jgi:hypothetical protein
MEQHPDCQPGRAIAMHRRNDDDGRTNQNFECERTDSLSLDPLPRWFDVNKSAALGKRERRCKPDAISNVPSAGSPCARFLPLYRTSRESLDVSRMLKNS